MKNKILLISIIYLFTGPALYELLNKQLFQFLFDNGFEDILKFIFVGNNDKLSFHITAADENFYSIYKSDKFRNQTYEIVKDCSGCMYGSYPEISISARYPKPLIDRTKLFLLTKMKKLQKNITLEYTLELAEKISKNYSK